MERREISLELQKYIETQTGFVFSEIHNNHVLPYVKQRMAELELDSHGYFEFVIHSKSEFENLVNELTVNETYFFREEQQFDFLAEWLFPKFRNRKFTFWSAACSTGEEALSVLALADEFSIKSSFFASDIDTNALEKMRSGIFSGHCFRSDGKKYHCLIEKFGHREENTFVLDQDFISRVRISQFNLQKSRIFPVIPGTVNLVMMRNVFIYFSEETRKEILDMFWNILADDGIILLSMSEIASVANDNYTKEHYNNVYFLKKKPLPQNLHDADEIVPAKDAPSVRSSGNVGGKPHAVTERKQALSERHEASWERKASDFQNSLPFDLFYKEIISLLGKDHVADAKELLKNQSFRVDSFEYKYFIEGLISEHEGEIPKTVECYEKAVILNKNFWPCGLKLALVYKSSGSLQKASELFSQLSQIILEYEKSGNMCYNFIVESFDTSYFLDICRANLNLD